MRKSIFLRRTVLLILISVLLSGVLSAGIYIFITQKMYADMRASELIPIARTVADMMSDARQSGNAYGQGVWPLLEHGNRNFLGATLHIFDAYGQSVMNPAGTRRDNRGNQQGPNEFAEEDTTALVKNKLSSVLSGTEVSAVANSSSGLSYLVVGVPITSEDNIIGAVVFTKDMRELNSSLYGLNLTLIFSTLIAFGLMLIPAYFAAKRLVVPIRDMQNIAHAMARGDFSIRADESQKGEIGELAQSMNFFAMETERLEQTRRDYVANVSHELRTPIASIRAMGETLRDGMTKTDEKRKLFYNNIVRESMRLSRLVEDLLELSRLQTGNEAIQKRSFDMREVFRNITDVYSHLTVEVGLILTVSADMDTSLNVMSNADRVEQVLIILMDNAMKHAGDNGEITMSCFRQNSKFSVSVTNTGEDIPEEDLPHIFDRFYTVDKSHSGGGNGLGLSIASEIMKGLGETIKADSKDGLTNFAFTVQLA
jgi:signal transduction histidine kinase